MNRLKLYDLKIQQTPVVYNKSKVFIQDFASLSDSEQWVFISAVKNSNICGKFIFIQELNF